MEISAAFYSLEGDEELEVLAQRLGGWLLRRGELLLLDKLPEWCCCRSLSIKVVEVPPWLLLKSCRREVPLHAAGPLLPC